MTPLALGPVGQVGDGVIGLRRQAAGDMGFIRDLYATQRAKELAPTGWDELQKAAFIDHQFTAQRRHLATYRADADYLIVERDGSAIGRLCVDRTVDPWRLVELALMPDHVGHGIGQLLMHWLSDSARSAGATAIDLHVAIDNVRAAAFYTRLGFTESPSDFASHRRLCRRMDGVS